jgi:hypothetical protein
MVMTKSEIIDNIHDKVEIWEKRCYAFFHHWMSTNSFRTSVIGAMAKVANNKYEAIDLGIAELNPKFSQ